MIIIEDDAAIVSQLRYALEDRYDITSELSYKGVCEIGDIYEYDIAIVDLGLPPEEHTVAEGLKVIRYLLDNSQCKIIVLTGQGTQEAAMACLEQGCFDFLTKPVMMDQLLFSLERSELFIKTERELQKTGIEKIEFNVRIGDGLQKLRESAEKNIIIKVLNDTGFNVYKASKILGVKRESLYYFMKKFNLVRKNDD